MKINHKISLIFIFLRLMVVIFYAQKSEGFFQVASSLELKTYENSLYGVNLKYPSNWRYYEEIGPENFSPDRIFQVSFLSPSNKVISDMVFVWFNIEDIKDSLNLDDRKNTLLENLNNSNVSVKVQSTKLSGIDAFMIDYVSRTNDLQRNIGIEAIKNGLLYSLDFTAEPDTFEKNIKSIETMINSINISSIT